MNKNLCKILIVDDDEMLREIYRLSLEMEGYLVSEAENGADALAQLLKSDPEELPSIILLDLMMPVMNGREFLEIIRTTYQRRFQNILVVICSAYGELPPSTYFSLHLEKPIHIEDLIKTFGSLTPFQYPSTYPKK